MNWGIRIASVIGAVALLFGIDAILPSMVDDYALRLVTLAGLYVTLSVSLNLINGITGQFSIGHAGFYMVGAYASLILSQEFYKGNMPPLAWIFVSMFGGAVAAGLTGLVVGLPSLRLKGDYLAIVTLGFGEIVRIIAINQREWGGSTGANIEPQGQHIWLVWLLAVVCIAVCRNLLRTAHGLPFLAVREDEVAAQAMGVNLTKTKVTAFVIGSAFAGAAGSLFAHANGFLSPELFRMEVSFLILTMVVLGGTGSITGATFAALLLFAIPELSRIIEVSVTLGSLMGVAIGVITVVAFLRAYRDARLPIQFRKPAIAVGGSVGILVVGVLLGFIFNAVPVFRNTSYDATQLRMVVLAVTLLVVMLLRPEGIFGYHEFSWDLFKRNRKRGDTLGGVA